MAQRFRVLSATTALLLLVVVVACVASSSQAHRLHRGRPQHKHGMLGEPAVPHRSQHRHHHATMYQHDLVASTIIDDDEDVDYGQPDIRWLKQRLDHFNPADRRSWRQRYMVNDQFSKSGGPVFLLLGGEGEASPKWLSAPTHVMRMAKKFGALVFQLEHRFYGKSHPTADMSTANLAYLSSQQALADAAAFRNVMTQQRNLGPDARWVVFGGSYSGSLAAWFKLKYPHLVVGAVASSAPMVALVDFKDYVRVVRDSLGPTCSEQVKAEFKQLELMATQRSQWPAIDKQFKTCVPFDANNLLNLQNFFQSVAGLFEGVVQYNKDQRISGPSNITIDTLCALMNQHAGSQGVDGLIAVNDLLMRDGKQSCLDYDYDKFVRSMRNVSFDAPSAEGGRQWTYQTCVEFGFFQSSDADDQPFGNLFPVQLFVQQCRDIFDDYFDDRMLHRAVFRTNTEYGGTFPRLRNVTFPNGSIDPWHALGVLDSLSDDVTANYIIGTAHCADMYPPADTDDLTLTQARSKIEKEVAKWLQV